MNINESYTKNHNKVCHVKRSPEQEDGSKAPQNTKSISPSFLLVLSLSCLCMTYRKTLEA